MWLYCERWGCTIRGVAVIRLGCILIVSNLVLLLHRWESVHEGVGLNQYHPFLPHARCLESAAMTNTEQLVFHGGCLSGGIGGGPCPAEDSWVLDGIEKEWTELPRCVTPRLLFV